MGPFGLAEVLKKRYASDHPDDNPQATKRIKDHIPGMKTYKPHPGAKHQPSTGTYSKKGKMAALKKQHDRRPEEYGITREEVISEKSVPNNPKLWAAKKAQAKSKFDVYPSAYANGWAAKQYKAAGGGWKKGK